MLRAAPLGADLPELLLSFYDMSSCARAASLRGAGGAPPAQGTNVSPRLGDILQKLLFLIALPLLVAG